ncbi:MAG: hypothetical protein C4526_00715 [Nitrospiraceae bacterium]|nr:MAG: hypothetical protein C4526_00715 [Nitrospiraceae bacterium]
MQNLLKYFLKNINLLNIILLTVIALGVYYVVVPFQWMDVKYELPSATQVTEDIKETQSEDREKSFTEYLILTEKNPFHPERIIPVEKKEEKPLPRPDIVLYGTVIAKDISLAYIEDKNAPVTSPGRGKRVRVIKKGDDISGFILKDIKPDRIVLVRGEQRMTVNIASPSKKRGLPEGPPVSQPKTTQTD